MKVVLNGETFDYDGQKAPMSECLAIEHVYKRRYVEWQSDMEAGSAKALCVLAWIIWRRDGRDVPFEDIIEGRADFDLMEMLTSMAESAMAEAGAGIADESAAPDPTTPPKAPASARGPSRSKSSRKD